MWSDDWWFIIVGVLLLLSFYDKGPTGLENQINSLPEHYNTRLPWWKPWPRRKSSEQRTKLVAQLHAEQVALTGIIAHEAQMIKTKSENEYMPQRMRDTHELTDATHKLNMTVARSAEDMRVDLLTYSEIRKQQEFERLKLDHELEKTRELEKLAVQRRWIEIEQDLRGAFIFNERDYQYLTMHQEYIFGLFDELMHLQEQKDSFVKPLKVRFLNRRIRNEQKGFYERQKRLLQTSSRKELRAGNEDTQSE